MEFIFESPLVQGEMGLLYYMVFLSPEATDYCVEHKIKRLVGTVQGQAIRLSPISDGKGGRYLILNKELLKNSGAHQGQLLRVNITPDNDPDRIDLSIELAELLAQDDEFAKAWGQLTQGRQRGLAHYSRQAKSIESRLKRAFELRQKLLSGQLAFQRAQGEQ